MIKKTHFTVRLLRKNEIDSFAEGRFYKINKGITVIGVLSQKIKTQSRLCLFARKRSEMLSFKWRHFKQDI
ncbi:hypothetical protein LDG_7186 [Legionella drancourtii LLAP12]|uniref:Uncharacterized protein n=1 Tax=Legionella drancourtii LLAP12 TaxID=658187 RepID=G9EPK0_9GAMM|nr:hypothetical protein LDG_7186 [Legionella drancourtii LLAP12]